MNRSDFLQEKATFLIGNPHLEELSFYQSFVANHPEEPIGWLHLGREYEKRGERAKALEVFRRGMHLHKHDAYSEEIRDAYQNLLRQKKQPKGLRFLRNSLALLLFLAMWLTIPGTQPVGELTVKAPPPPPAPSQPTAKQGAPFSHTEVIAIPDTVSGPQLDEQLNKYLNQRRTYFTKPFTLLVVPETDGLALFTSLPFYKPELVRGIVSYDPGKQAILSEKWFAHGCSCEDDPLVQATKQQFRQEQVALEQALTLRNALYRHYQRAGKLPTALADLASAYPANMLSAIPQLRVPPSPGDTSNQPTYANWTYAPAAFQPERAWQSLSEVVPLAYYPEPSVPLEPLQVIVYQSSFSMRLMSGPYLVRQYPVGIGKESLTPEGYYTILQKVSQPRSRTNAYGTRGMVFSSANHAMHGTNDPTSIGKSVSHGCIRLHNDDVEELYSFVSPGTEVIISDKKQPSQPWDNAPRFTLPAGQDEETPNVVYHWLD